MPLDSERPQPETSPPPGSTNEPGTAPPPADLRAECERLRSEVRRLEKERDKYRRLSYQCLANSMDGLGEELTDEILLDMIANEKWVPLEDFIDELEQIGKEQ
jgi:hypothetical protein